MLPSHGHDMAIVNGVSRIGYMTGGSSALWVDEEIADTITRKAESFIEAHKQHPFFLYFATHDIHVPRLPDPRFKGKSQHGARGDAIPELDWSVGEIMSCLDRNGLTRDTLVIFSSDNGPVVDDGYRDQAVEKLDAQAGRPAARRQVQQLRRRHAHPDDRALAGAREARHHVQSFDEPGGLIRIHRGAYRRETGSRSGA